MKLRKGLVALIATGAIGLGSSENAKGAIANYDNISADRKLQEQTPTWEFVADMNTERSGLASAIHNGFIYAIGGSGKTSVERYSLSTNTWEFVSPMNIGRDRFSAINVNGKIYAVSGKNSTGNLTDIVEIYDPNNDSWIVSPYRLSIPRTGFGLAKDKDNKIYAIGGASHVSGASTTSVEVFDTNNPSLGWQFLPHNLISTRVGVLGGTDKLGRIYGIGGNDFGSMAVERFDPNNSSLGWQVAPSLHLGGGLGASTTSFKGDIFVLEGNGFIGVEKYDSNSDSWSIHSHLNASAQYAAAVHDDVNGYLYKLAGDGNWGGDGTNAERVYTGIVIPEPSSLGIIGVGLVGAALGRKKRQ